MPSGGSIQLRLSVAGADEVKLALASLGPAGAKALREIEQAQVGPNAGMRGLSAAAKDVGGAMEGMASRLGAAGSGLSAMGPAGMAAAAGIAAVVGAAAGLARATEGAMQFGEQLLASARAAGVNTTTLQQYRYAAEQSGVASAVADQALKSFAERFGAAGEGVKRYLPFLEKLGFTPEQMESWKTQEQAVDTIAAKIATLGNASDRAFFAQKFGLEALLPVLAQGAEHFEKVKQEALDVGAVMDDHVVKSLAGAEERFKSASDVINVQFKSALVDLAPTLVSLIGLVADLARQLNGFMSLFQSAQDKADSALVKDAQTAMDRNADLVRQRGPSFFAQPWSALPMNRGGPSQRADWSEYHQNADLINSNAAILTQRQKDGAAATNTPPLGNFTPTATSRGTHGPTADELGQRNAALLDQGAADLLKARKEELQAQLGLTVDVNKRAEIQKQINALDLAAEKTAEDRKDADAKAKLDQVLHAKTSTDADRRAAQAAYDGYVADETAARAAQGRAQVLKDDLDTRTAAQKTAEEAEQASETSLQSQLAAVQAQLAITANLGARRALALKQLDLDDQIRIAKLNEVISDTSLTDTARQDAQTQLNTIFATRGARQTAVSNANLDPWSAMLNKMAGDVQPIGTEFQKVAAGGLEQFNDGLFDAQGRLNNLGTLARNVLASMLKSLEDYLAKQAEIGLFGDGQGTGGGGITGMIMGMLGFGGSSGGAGGAGVLTTDNVASLAGSFSFADGGRVVGPGGPRSDSVLAAVSHGEFIVNAEATRHWGPVLEAINSGRPMHVRHYADGGSVGGVGGFPDYLMVGPTSIHPTYVLNAHGADAGRLMALEDMFKEHARQEPNRFVAYAQKTGLLAKGRRPVG